MTDIPEDVMKAAREAHFKAMTTGECNIGDLILANAAAIMAERERCALVAYHTCAKTRHVSLGNAVAAAIRGEDDKSEVWAVWRDAAIWRGRQMTPMEAAAKALRDYLNDIRGGSAIQMPYSPMDKVMATIAVNAYFEAAMAKHERRHQAANPAPSPDPSTPEQ